MSELKHIQWQFRQSANEALIDEMVIFKNQFHSKIGEMSDNHYLAASLQRLLVDHDRIAHVYCDRTLVTATELLQTRIDQHEQLITAIDRGMRREP